MPDIRIQNEGSIFLFEPISDGLAEAGFEIEGI
jgi:hypothetical protein